MFRTYEAARRRRLQAVGAALGSTALVTFVGLVPPGQAAAQEVETYESNRYRGHCLELFPRERDVAYTPRCSDKARQRWRVIGKGRIAGHRLVKLRSVKANRCLDSEGRTPGYEVDAKPCNRDDEWQIWEVFRNGNGTITFKNWGAYVRQGRHYCMRARARYGFVELAVCNARGRPQQWR